MMAYTTLKKEVVAALQGIPGVVAVFNYYPEEIERLPCVTFYEPLTVTDADADDDEYSLTIDEYIDVWAERVAEAEAISGAVDTCMKELGFVRTFAADDFTRSEDTDSPRRKILRYRITV